MEEKKPIKVSLSTCFLILAIIIIIVMGCFIYKLYNDKQIQYKNIDSLNAQNSKLTNNNQELQNVIHSTSKVENNNENIQNSKDNNANTSNTTNDNKILNDEELFFCENVITNKDGTFTLRGVIYEPYKISTDEFKEMLKQDKIVLKENNLSYILKNNECIIKKLDNDEFMPYEVLSSENLEHFCYINGNDNEGYKLELGTDYSTIWKKTDKSRNVTLAKDTYYLDIESLEYANNMSKDEIEEKVSTLFNNEEDKFKSLEGKYLKFSNIIYSVKEGVTSFH